MFSQTNIMQKCTFKIHYMISFQALSYNIQKYKCIISHHTSANTYNQQSHLITSYNFISLLLIDDINDQTFSDFLLYLMLKNQEKRVTRSIKYIITQSKVLVPRLICTSMHKKFITNTRKIQKKSIFLHGREFGA